MLLITGCQSILTPGPTATLAPLGPGDTANQHLATPTTAPDIYLTPIPPTATLTPTLTPTPVIHSIESGDTLFGIALDYGVSVEALLRANGIGQNDILRIGQVLVIPLDEEEIPADGSVAMPVGRMILPTPTPLPMNISDAGAVVYDTPVGGIWCMGEVVNSLDVPVTNMQVEITLLAPDDTPLLTAMTLVAADYLSPGDTAPFAMLFPSPPAGVQTASVNVLRAEQVSAITSSFVPLRIEGAEGAVSGPQYRVRGTLVNESGANVIRVTVVVTLYDEDRHVLGYRQLVLPDDQVLAAGTTRTFDLTLSSQGVQSPAGYSAIAWAVIQ